VETLDSSVFLQQLARLMPDLWNRALETNMVVIAPQAISLETASLTRRMVGEALAGKHAPAATSRPRAAATGSDDCRAE